MGANRVLFDLTALLASMALLMLGNGLQGTLLGIRAGIENFAPAAFGLVMSSYFVGYIIGAFTVPRLVERVGHIRIFAIMASAASITAVLHGYFLHPAAWFVMRAVTGMSLVGLYLVTESWLNGRTNPKNRGTVFSVYMVISLGAIAVGQQILHLDDPSTSGLFIISSVLFSLAVIPVGLTRAQAPAPIPSKRMPISKLYSISPLGVVGTFFTGLSNGAFWGIIGVYAYEIGLSTSQTASFISLFVFGGMILQAPLGWASDRIDRRYFIVGLSVVISVTSLIMIPLGPENIPLLYGTSFIYGGFLLTVNAICNSHVHDHIEQKDVVRVSSTLLLIFGIGAAIGPTLVSIMIGHFGPPAFFSYISFIQGIVIIFALWRALTSKTVIKKRRHYTPVVPTMPRLAFFNSGRFSEKKKKSSQWTES